MIWRVWHRPTSSQERIEADECYDSQNGTLKFMNYVPLAEVEKIEPCGKACANGKPCVRDSGHGGKHMDKLKPKYVKRLVYPVRAFAPGSWTDVELVKDAETLVFHNSVLYDVTGKPQQ